MDDGTDPAIAVWFAGFKKSEQDALAAPFHVLARLLFEPVSVAFIGFLKRLGVVLTFPERAVVGRPRVAGLLTG